MRRFSLPLLGLCLWLAATQHLPAQTSEDLGPLSRIESSRVDEAVQSTMQRNEVPGSAELTPGLGNFESDPRIANASTRFAIGSVTKEFTAAAILLLCDRGKLSLDDPVSKYLPQLTEANHVTIRELLSHTSGYRDYFLQEYIPVRMQHPTSIDAILSAWAERPLDFPPGQQWQYSGTNYVIAGRIVEKVTGESYHKFLIDNVLRPVGITDATFADVPSQTGRNAVGYYRFALGPPRLAPATGRNWLFAMADLEMTAKDVALWDISVINQSLLSPASYKAMSSDTKTTDGRSTGYALGFFVRQIAGADGRQHLLLHHPGEISGFRSHNFILPDLNAAVVILTNAEYSDVTTQLAESLQGLVGIEPAQPFSCANRVSSTPSSSTAKENDIEARPRKLLLNLAQGRIDRVDLSADAAATFSPQAVADIRQSLAPLGDLEHVRLDSTQLRGGTRHYALTLVHGAFD